METNASAEPPTISQSGSNPPGLSVRVVKSSVWTLIGQIVPLGASFIATPIVIRLVGSEGYGIIALLVLIPQYLYFTDLGMSSASTKFSAEAYSKGDANGEASVIRTAAALALIGSVPPAIVVFVFAGIIGSLLGIPDEYVNEGTAAIRLAAITTIFALQAQVINSPLLSRLRMDIASSLSALSRIVGIAGVPIALYLGLGFEGAAGCLLAAAVIYFVSLAYFSGREVPKVWIPRIDPQVRRSLLRFGIPLMLSVIASIAVANIEKAALSSMTSVRELAHYSVAFSLAITLGFFPAALMASLIPTFSQLQHPEARASLETLYGRMTRLIIFPTMPLIMVLAIAGRPFLTLWAGPEFGQDSTLPLYILLIGFAFNVAAYSPNSMMIASGRTDLLARIYWLELVPYALILLVFVGRWGAEGAAAAFSLRAIADSLLQFAAARRVTGLKIEGLRLGPMALGVLTLIAGFVATQALSLSIIASGLVAAFALGVYALIVFQYLAGRDETRWAISLIRERLGFVKR